MVYKVLYNPKAGNGTGLQSAKKIEGALAGANVEYVDVTAISDMQQYLDGLADGEQAVLAGGDGTINHFINDVDCDALTHSIMYYPAGSGNDFLKDVRPEWDGKPFALDEYIKGLPIVTVKGKTVKFINNVGFGIDGYCCEVGDQIRATSDKPVNYTNIAIKGLLGGYKRPNAEVTVDGVTKTYKKVWLAPTMNGRYYGGGMMCTPGQDRLSADGKESVAVMYGQTKLKCLMIFPSIFKGEHVKHTEMVEVVKGDNVHVKFDAPTALQIDGETVLAVTEYTVKSRAAANKKD